MTDAYAAWKYAEDTVTERQEIVRARRHALEAGVEPISAATGAQLAQLAAAIDARHILEIEPWGDPVLVNGVLYVPTQGGLYRVQLPE